MYARVAFQCQDACVCSNGILLCMCVQVCVNMYARAAFQCQDACVCSNGIL